MIKGNKKWQFIVVLFMTAVITFNLRMLYQSDEVIEEDCDRPVIIEVKSNVDVVVKNVDTAYLKWPTLNASHVKMLGHEREKKGFLTIGIPSIKRITGTQYLVQTIRSLADHTSSSEKLKTVVVVFLADFDTKYNTEAVKILTREFKDLISIGFLQIVQATKDYYPSFDNLKHNFHDKDDRVRWRAKQIMDFCFMFMYAYNISDYYIQLEDDVISAGNFIDSINSYIHFQKAKTWTMLEFSELGFIGKLFRSSDLPKLSKFMLAMWEEQPIDWLLTYFRLASAQNDVLMRKPTLFQHIGRKSSFDISSDNKLQDRFFDSGDKKWRADDPPGTVHSDMQSFQHYGPDLCYASGSGFFWAKEPRRGEQVMVHFAEPQKLKRVAVETGGRGSKHAEDILRSGTLEASPRFMRMMTVANVSMPLCADWRKIGEFEGGRVDSGELSTWNRPTECLRITLTQEQDNWIVFDQIAVFVYK